MHTYPWKRVGSALLVGMLAIAGCSGEKGANGTDGTDGTDGVNGTNGTNGTNGMSSAGGKLKLVIDGVATATVNGAQTSTLTFTVYPAAAVCPGGTCNTNLSNLKQKTFYATKYEAPKFTTSFSFSGYAFKGITADGKGAQYTATKAGAAFAPEADQHAEVYGYIGDKVVIPTTKGHYALMDNVASAAKVYGSIDYDSAANVEGCETCHIAPYSKHGYRQAKVANLPNFAACKVCHTDVRPGVDFNFQVTYADPLLMLERQALPEVDGEPDWGSTVTTNYKYTASVMNDTHMAHAMEIGYPQSMANCNSCHAGKLARVLDDSKFTLDTCRSCHPVEFATGAERESVRADSLKAIIAAKGVGAMHTFDWYAASSRNLCVGCHQAGGAGKTFAQLHTGYATNVTVVGETSNTYSRIYKDDGTRYADAVQVKIDSATLTNNVLSIKFSATQPAAFGVDLSTIVPTLLVSLYGYDTKDFLVSCHAKDVDTARNLEWQVGAAANPRVALVSAANGQWEMTADLSFWAAKIGAGKAIRRAEIGVQPLLTIGTQKIALNAPSRTFDLVTGEFDDAFFKPIVAAAKCNVCHDALGTTFHSASYGNNVVLCRMCHVAGTAGGHLEMQSRSIDSYVHAIHSMQPFDVGSINFADKVAALRYNEKIESTYPSFSTLNCESCHNAGTYEVPDQTKSLPGVISASATLTGKTRAIAGVPSYVVGPASRACGSCHRSELANEDEAGTLAAFNAHTGSFGTLVANGNFVDVTENIMATLGGPAATNAAPAGTQLESCVVCHPNAGAEHQAVFDSFADGL